MSRRDESDIWLAHLHKIAPVWRIKMARIQMNYPGGKRNFNGRVCGDAAVIALSGLIFHSGQH